jgi:hypothetical protein
VEGKALTDSSLALLEELNLGSARGAKRVPAPLTVEIVRSLTEEDLPKLLEPPPIESRQRGLVQIRHSHHQLAQLLAKGSGHTEASLVTGYSMSYIWTLQQDPSFVELLAHYQKEREAVFIDVLERMKSLGISTLEVLQERLEDSNEAWTKRELMEMAELMLLKPHQTRGPAGFGASGGAPAVSVNVKFVTAQQAGQQAGGPSEVSSPVVDLDWNDVEGEGKR